MAALESVPVTVTFTSWVSVVLLGPATVSVYVVVAVGVTWRVPRAVTLPMFEMVTLFGFSVDHVSTMGCPAATVVGLAVKLTMRAGGTGLAGAAAGFAGAAGAWAIAGKVMLSRQA